MTITKENTYKVLSIDAWSDGLFCPECDSHKVLDNTGKGLKCACCLFEDLEENFTTTWDWNQWFSVATYHEDILGPLNFENAQQYFMDNFTTKQDWYNFEIEDDQHNLVLVMKKSRRPIYAIEYGN